MLGEFDVAISNFSALGEMMFVVEKVSAEVVGVLLERRFFPPCFFACFSLVGGGSA